MQPSHRPGVVRHIPTLIALALLIAAARVRRFAVAERSMAPALQPGDWLLARPARRVRPAQIVIYPSPTDPEFWLIKRVLAVGPARVSLDLGIVTVDGRTLDEPEATGAGATGTWDVPDGHVFVLGDNRALSTGDSAAVGPIPVERIDSIARWRYWPAARIGRV